MDYEIQKAGLWQRMAAGFLDVILIITLAVGAAALISWLTGYETYSATLKDAYAKYSAQYNVDMEMTAEEYEALSETEKEAFKAASEKMSEAMNNDADAVKAYTMIPALQGLIITGGILIAVMLLEFLVPMLLGNGQTVGKKAFSISVVRIDGVKMNNMQLFTRTLLGKFTVEIMLPVFLWLNWGLSGMLIPLAVMLIAQCVILIVTKNNYLLHDLMAGTVVVNHNSQRTFSSTEELLEHQKRAAAERAARQKY